MVASFIKNTSISLLFLAGLNAGSNANAIRSINSSAYVYAPASGVKLSAVMTATGE